MRRTRLAFNQAGEGWHLRPLRDRVFRGLGVVAAVLFGSAALLALLAGRVMGAVVLGGLAFAFGVIPYADRRRPLEPRLWTGPVGVARKGEHRTGLLLPVQPMKATVLAVIGVLAVVSLAMAGWMAAELVRGREWVLLVGILLLGGVGLLFAAGTIGGLRSRRTPDKGVVLLPDGVLLRTRTDPELLGWDEIAAVRAHWTRLARVWPPMPDDQIRNWLTFERTPLSAAHARRDQLALLSGSPSPSVAVEDLAMDPHVVLEAAQYYLATPAARGELAGEQALARLRTFGRTRRRSR
ncbi:hypothetical protein [Nocardioides pacificus]